MLPVGGTGLAGVGGAGGLNIGAGAIGQVLQMCRQGRGRYPIGRRRHWCGGSSLRRLNIGLGKVVADEEQRFVGPFCQGVGKAIGEV